VLHVQVATRFMVATPPLYWHLARLATGGSKWAARAVCIWVGVFACVGTVLFATFLPWT
jgi:phosphatidylinositol glycan class V